jgi:POT family proton-dependent oligopeptide transporter
MLENYMEHPPHYNKTDGTPGALGLGQAAATRIYCCFYIFYYVTPTCVAVVADSHSGKYMSLLVSIIMYCLGIVALTVSSIPTCIEKGLGLPGLVVAMFLIGLGGGGVKAILPPFLADQYTRTKPRFKTLKSGEQVVTDYELTLQYIYNLYFWVGNVGSLSWFGTVFIEKHYGFAGAYGLTFGLMVIALIILIVGKRWYVVISRQDNLIVRQATKIIGCAIKNGCSIGRTSPRYQLENHHKTVTWDAHMVEELSRGFGACRVLLTFVTFYVCFDQMQNNLISQAGEMKTKSTPNDLLPALNQVGCIFLGPLIQLGLYPFLHRHRIYMEPIMRIAIGFGFMTLAMLYATVVQYAIYNSHSCSDDRTDCAPPAFEDDRPNVWIQAPVYFLIATSETFSYVTGLEYAYDHSPKDMKVIVQAFNLLIGGIGSTIALALTAVAQDPKLMVFYASLTGAMLLTTVLLAIVFRKYDRKQVSLEEPLFHESCPMKAEKFSSLRERQINENRDMSSKGSISAHQQDLTPG